MRSKNQRTTARILHRKKTNWLLEELKQEGDIQDRKELYRVGNGYFIGYANDFNAKYAIAEIRFWHFLETRNPTN